MPATHGALQSEDRCPVTVRFVERQQRVRMERVGQTGRDGETSVMKARKMKLETGRVDKRHAIAVPVRIASLDRLWLV